VALIVGNCGLAEFEVGADTTVLFAAGSRRTIQIPENDSPSPFATSLAKYPARFDQSIGEACRAITGREKSWSGGVTDVRLGQPSGLQMVESIRGGKTPGEEFINSAGMPLRWCPPGRFQMGSGKTDV